MMNLCRDCGRELPESARFCPHCGAGTGDQGVSAAAETEPSGEAPTPARRARAGAPAPKREPAPELSSRPVDQGPPVIQEGPAIEEVTEGEWLRLAEEVFPIAWLTMVVAVSYIAIYFAVEAMPGRNLLPGPGWFG